MARVAVVGAGVGGLAVAARLAVKGHQVTVFEQGPRVGGKLVTYERDGFRFDLGPSLLTLPAVYRDLFLKTGHDIADYLTIEPVEPGYQYHFSDGSQLELPGVGVGAIATAMNDRFGDSAGTAWIRYMQRARDMWAITRRPVLESPIRSARDLAALAKNPRDVRTIAPWLSLTGIIGKYLSDPRQRMIAARYATFTGSDPRKAPAVLSTIPYLEQTFGMWHIQGGLGRLAEALHARCLERSVTIECSTQVTSITTSGDRVAGVVLGDGSTFACDIVVNAGDARNLYGHLVEPAAAPKEGRRILDAQPSLSGFVIVAAVRGTTPDTAHHNVWFPTHYDAEFDDIFAGRPAQDPAIYACIPRDSTMAPSGTEAWFFLVNAPPHGSGSGQYNWTTSAAEQYRDHILATLAQRGVDIRSRIMFTEIRTPADLARTTHTPGGSIYGPASHGATASFLRAPNQSNLGGLFNVGGTAHPGGGLPLVGLGVEITANLIGRSRQRTSGQGPG